jgi:hypothetical protein
MARKLKRDGKPLFPNRHPKLVELRHGKIRWSIFNSGGRRYPACLATELAAVAEQIANDQGGTQKRPVLYAIISCTTLPYTSVRR